MGADSVNLGHRCKHITYIGHYTAGHYEFGCIIGKGNTLANITNDIHSGVKRSVDPQIT